MKYHDTHFHLDLMSDPEKVADEIEKNQVYTIAVTNSPSVFFFTEKIASERKFIRPSLGLHPELAAERYKEVEQFSSLIDRSRYIGEIGLDNSKKSPRDYQKQKEVFEKLITICADKGDKILSVHSRRAAKDVLDILGKNFPGKVILHWYSDSLRHVEAAADRGYYFSFNYKMLQSQNGQQILNRVPKNQILLESDAPFTTPTNVYFTQLIVNTLELIGKRGISFDVDDNSIKNTVLNNFYELIQDKKKD